MATGELTVGAPRAHRLGGVPIFMYHALTASRPPAGAKYRLPAVAFQEHLAVIKGNGFRPILLRTLWTHPNPTEAHHAVGLTFDDGDVSHYTHAYPALVEAEARADFFVNTATVDRPGFLSWAQIAEMQRAGFSFQSHSHDHIALIGLPRRVLERQLRDSKRLLEERLGTRVDFLAAPYGLLNSRVVRAAHEVGYRAVCTSWSWPAHPGARTVSRIAVYPHTSAIEFVQLLQGRPPIFLRRVTRILLTHIPKRVLLRLRPRWLGVQVPETGP
jgi:peptidoglycan/xylan/chitin deacetylase (PgdA/CDA1 family)